MKENIPHIVDDVFYLVDTLFKDFLTVYTDQTGHLTRLSVKWEEVLGFTIEELMSKPFVHFIHPDDVVDTMSIYLKRKPTPIQEPKYKGFINRYKTKDGRYAILEWINSTHRKNGQDLSIAILRGYESPK
jgi:PAS domain S-box-containing protein